MLPFSTSGGTSSFTRASVGVAVPGNINHSRALVVYSKPLDWTMVNLAEELASWHPRLHLVNNAMAGAMTEYFDNTKASRTTSLLYILIHFEHLKQYTVTSLGCAIVLDGRAYFGEGQTGYQAQTQVVLLAWTELGNQALDVEKPFLFELRFLGVGCGRWCEIVFEGL